MFVQVSYIISSTISYSLAVFLKILNMEFYCIIKHRYFGRMYTEKVSGRALRLESVFRDDLFYFLLMF